MIEFIDLPWRWRWISSSCGPVPGLTASIVVVVLGTIGVALFHVDAATIGSRFGANAIPPSLPIPHWPAIDLAQIKNLIRPTFTIAMLAASESLLCAGVADGMIEDRHDSNQELMAQGLANFGSALFGGTSGHECHRS